MTTETTSRPDGVVLTAIWFIVGAVFSLIGIVAILIFALPAVFTDTTSGIDRYMAVAGVTFGAFIIAILGIADLAAAIGVLQLKGWGRILSIVLAAMGLMLFPVGTIVGVLIIWYMLGDDAKQAFAVDQPKVPDSPAGLEAMSS